MVEFYKDAKGEWRWRLVAPNGRQLADSSEGYRRRGAAKSAWDKVKALAPTARTVEIL